MDNCQEREQLREVYLRAIRNLTDSGGMDPSNSHQPNIIAHKQAVEEAIGILIEHRKEHGC